MAALLVGANLTAESAVAQENLAARLERQYDQESNQRKRARLAMDLTKERWKQLKSAYDAEDQSRRETAGNDYLAAIERLDDAVTAAAHTGTSKTVEMHLRRQGRDLENLKTNVSYFDRPAVEKIIARVSALREKLLYSVMGLRKGKAKK